MRILTSWTRTRQKNCWQNAVRILRARQTCGECSHARFWRNTNIFLLSFRETAATVKALFSTPCQPRLATRAGALTLHVFSEEDRATLPVFQRSRKRQELEARFGFTMRTPTRSDCVKCPCSRKSARETRSHLAKSDATPYLFKIGRP